MEIPDIGFPAERAKMEIFVGEFLADLKVEGFRHKKGPASLAGL